MNIVDSILGFDIEDFVIGDIASPSIDLDDDNPESNGEHEARTVCCPKCGFEFEV